MLLIIPNSLRLGLHNLPGDVFELVGRYDQDENNLILHITDVSAATSRLRRFDPTLQFEYRGIHLLMTRPVTTTDTLRPTYRGAADAIDGGEETPGQQQVDERIYQGQMDILGIPNQYARGLQNMQNMAGQIHDVPRRVTINRRPEQPQTAPILTAPRVLQNIVDNGVQQVRLEEDRQFFEGLTEDGIDADPIPRVVPVTENRFAPENCIIVSPENVQTELAKALRNHLSTSASVVENKMLELDRLLTKANLLKREIALLQSPIIQNEKVQKVMQQMLALELTDNLVDKVKIVKMNNCSWITVFTKDIETERLSDNTIRKIGKMAIMIGMQTMLAEVPANSGATGHCSIIIYNLTQVAHHCGRAFQCGHVNSSGSACLGNITDDVYQCFLNTELTVMVDLLIKLIRNPDLNDQWGSAAKCFPIKMEAEAAA